MKTVQITNVVGWCVSVIRNAASTARRKVGQHCLEQLEADGGIEVKCAGLDSSFVRAELMMLLDLLEPKERYVIYHTYVLGETQKEIAESLQISQQHASRLKFKGLEHLKALMSEKVT